MTKQTLKSLLLSLCVVAAVALASSVSIPHTFTPGSTISSSQMNANFAAVKAAVDDNDARLSALVAPRTYTPANFVTGWANVAGNFQTAGSAKDALGFVHVRGLVRRTSGSLNNVLTLPVGMRPPANLQFPARCGNDTLCYVTVNANGNLDFGGPAAADPGISLTLDGIVFDTN